MGLPQWGHASASELTLPLHSGHFRRAIMSSFRTTGPLPYSPLIFLFSYVGPNTQPCELEGFG